MLKVLLKKQLAELFRGFFYDSKSKKARSKSGRILCIVGYLALMVFFIGGMFFGLSMGICKPLVDSGNGWLFFALLGLISVLLGLFGSVFNTYSSLYLSKDNDLLLSMPIPVGSILFARLAGVYLMGLMFSTVVFVPAMIVYWIVVPFSAASTLGMLLMFFLLSVLTFILSCLLGWVVAAISLRLKNKNFITLAISLTFLALYFLFYFRAVNGIEEMIANIAAMGDSLRSKAAILWYFGKIGEGYWLSCLIFTAAILGIAALILYFIKRSYLKIATSSGKTSTVVYREKKQKEKSLFGAVLWKEFKRFTGSANYMLNCGLGSVFTLVLAVAVIIKGADLGEQLLQVLGWTHNPFPVLCCAAVLMMSGVVDTAACSVSLEGKHYWIYRTLPIPTQTILQAKTVMQMLLVDIPALVLLIAAAAVWKFTTVEFLLTAATIALSTWTVAELDLAVNLRHPNLTWTNEITPIKQSFSVFIALFGCWIIGTLYGVGYFFLGELIPTWLFLLFSTALFGGIGVLLRLWIRSGGVKRFENLGND